MQYKCYRQFWKRKGWLVFKIIKKELSLFLIFALIVGIGVGTLRADAKTDTSSAGMSLVNITFDANGGIGGTNAELVCGTLLEPPTVTRRGYTFTGWLPLVPQLVPDENTVYLAQWVCDELSVGIELKLGWQDSDTGPFIPLGSGEELHTGDVVTVRIASENDFLIGISRYVVMFSKEYFSVVGSGSNAFAPNLNNSFYAQVASGYSGATTIPEANWPSTLGAFENYNFYSAIAVGNNANSNSPNGGYPGYLAGDWLFCFNLLVTQDIAAGSNAKIWMDNRWVKSPDYPQGASYFVKCQPGQYAAMGSSSYRFDVDITGAVLTLPLKDTDNISLVAAAGSTTIFDQADTLIYGLETGLSIEDFESSFIKLTGNGRLEYTPETGFGTGSKVRLVDNFSLATIITYTIIIFGDLNGDGNIDTIDAGILVDFENHRINWGPPSDAIYSKAGDLNSDGNLDSIDAGIAVDLENHFLSIDQCTGKPGSK